MNFERLAFVDIETSGLSPTANRITEIGVVAVDGNRVAEWTTLVNPGIRIREHTRLFNGLSNEVVAAAPRFKDIATDLAERLNGRLLIAHNARFDFGFLRSEFARLRMDFQPQVLCSVMLSRKLYPAEGKHDLDSLMQRHTLTAEVRHRALPDARLVWQFWRSLRALHPDEHVNRVIKELLDGPVLPAHLDASLLERLPEGPGVYILEDDDKRPLYIGRAGNLKRHVLNYFRIDRSSRKALAISHLVRNITWRIAQGPIGTYLQFRKMSGVNAHRASHEFYSWRLLPDAYPCIDLTSLPVAVQSAEECYGAFGTEAQARSALVRLARHKYLCHAALGIRETEHISCGACDVRERKSCILKTQRLRHFSQIATALRPLRLPTWPYDGAIGIREHRDLHIVDAGRYLGTAQNEAEVHSILDVHSREFDQKIYEFLVKTLKRLPRKRIVLLENQRDEDHQSNESASDFSRDLGAAP